MTEIVNVVGGDGTLVDVVFLHGLDGDAQSTWAAAGWPGWLGWLGADLPAVAIWTVGYGAGSSGWRRRRAIPIVDRATNLLALLENVGIGQRPVCFVVHSMGGLILKEMLLDSADGGINPALASATRAVAFLATPHNGSRLADFADRFRSVYRGTPAIVDLKRDDAHLRRASSRYRLWAARSGAAHLVFFETLSVKGLRVVDEGSSDPGIAGARPIPVDADHSGICKPDSRQSLVYGQIRDLLQRVVDEVAPGRFPGGNTDAHSGSQALKVSVSPYIRVTTRDALGRSIEIQAFDREAISIVLHELRLTDTPEGSSHD